MTYSEPSGWVAFHLVNCVSISVLESKVMELDLRRREPMVVSAQVVSEEFADGHLGRLRMQQAPC